MFSFSTNPYFCLLHAMRPPWMLAQFQVPWVRNIKSVKRHAHACNLFGTKTLFSQITALNTS